MLHTQHYIKIQITASLINTANSIKAELYCSIIHRNLKHNTNIGHAQ